MNGIINIYKEQGYTSHDVVAKLRGILRMKKIGHTGTLDPDAVGVLPVCTGRATKLCGMITDWGKTYEAVMLLGTRTDTQDISGNILSQTDVNVTVLSLSSRLISLIRIDLILTLLGFLSISIPCLASSYNFLPLCLSAEYIGGIWSYSPVNEPITSII